MQFNIVPLDMALAPNIWAPTRDGAWTLTGPNAQTIWGLLEIIDALGPRRYLPATGSSLTVQFLRADLIASNQGLLGNTPQSVTKPGIPFSGSGVTDGSLFSFVLSSTDVTAILGGTAQFTLTEGASVTTWMQNFAIRKLQTDPGF